MSEVLQVSVPDGTHLEVSVFPSSEAPEAPVVVILPAMGVRASYYAPLAESLVRNGLQAITADLRGNGKSSVRAGRAHDFGYYEMVEWDYPAVMEQVRSRFPASQIHLLGHSLGGQLACLYCATAPQPPDSLILIATCSVYRKGWSFPMSVGLPLFQQIGVLLARALGHFPGYRLGFGGRDARRLMRDWARQGLTGRYEVPESAHDFETRLDQFEGRVLAITIEDDTYSPPRATRHLLGKMARADVTHLHFQPEELGRPQVGHFSWVKHPDPLVPHVTDWLGA